MQITVSGHHVKITDALKERVNSKLQRLSRHYDRIDQVHVVLNVEGSRQKAEATMHMKGMDLFADAVDADLYTAIDTLTAKLDRQIIKYKEKLTSRMHG